jgi:hypothetical protein
MYNYSSSVFHYNFRMRDGAIASSAYIMVSVPRTVFYSFVYPQLNKPHFWSAHYGDWAEPTFCTRLVSSNSRLKTLRNIFGNDFVSPKQRADLPGYNTDPAKGPLSGYLLFLNYQNGFTLSVCLYDFITYFVV